MISKPQTVIDKHRIMDDYPRFLVNFPKLGFSDLAVIVHLMHEIFYKPKF